MTDSEPTGGAALAASDWHRLNALLKAALDLDPVARKGWLDELAPDAQDLKPLLQRLLSAELSDGTSQTLQPVVQMASVAMASMRCEQPGDRVGPWRLDRLLAEGGMGSVWLAQRADGVMQRAAALKLPRAEWVDLGLTERIAREREILARLQHPYIAVLYDAGQGADGRPYLALEFVDGLPIDAWCAGRDPRETVRLFVQVVRAVAYAHSQLVIHRDIKPGNVLVTAEGVPKLLDFGISKLLEGSSPLVDETALTRRTGRALTLAYAAPEQVLGEAVGATADVYALGVLLFELLSEVRLYRAQEPRALEAEVLQGEPRAVSTAALQRDRARQLRGDLDAVVATALKRQPGERYQSAAALADDLERWLTGEPVHAQPDRLSYRLRKYAARHWLPLSAGGAVVLALSVGLGLALWQAGVAKEQARRATTLNTFVLSLIRQADPHASRQTKAADLALLAAIEDRIDAELDGSPDQQLQLRMTMADAYRNRGEVAAARRVLQRSLETAARQLPADDLRLQAARVRAADPSLIVSSRAAEQLAAALPVLRRLGAPAASTLIDALLHHHVLAEQYGLPSHLPPPRRLELLREADTVARRHFGVGSPQHLQVTRHLAGLVEGMEGEDSGRQLIESALASAKARGLDADSSVEGMQLRVALALHLCYRKGRREEGRQILLPMIRSVRSSHGVAGSLLEDLLVALSNCATNLREGMAGISEAYEIAAAREQPPSMARLRLALVAYDAAVSGRSDAQAEGFYRSVQENLAAIPEQALQATLTKGARAARVCQLAKRGDAAEAEALGSPLLASLLEDHARRRRSTPLAIGTAICLSDAKRHLGRPEAAIADLTAIANMCRSAAPVWARSCEARPQSALALLLLDMGRLHEARSAVERRLALVTGYDREPRFALAHGRLLIGSGRAAEAVPLLQQAVDDFRDTPDAPHEAAELRFWLGHARLASGDRQGQALVDQARQALTASPMNWHRRLAASSARPL